MRLFKILLAIISFAPICMVAQKDAKSLNYYLPNIAYDPKIPTPESYLGYQIGEWHVSHDQLLGYFKALDAASTKIELKTYAKSHEGRPLIYAIISNDDNMARIDQIKKSHQMLADPKTASSVDIETLPAILQQGYTIHGNEPSGNNGALLVAYYLVAGQSAEVKNTLKNTVILLDPCLNPDGAQRFATWVNSHKGQNLSSDPVSRELNEVWPGGRYNHYWFDMNRDWLLLVHPESRGRIQTFHEWRPNVLTDHHEMGTNSTFFFQPGIPTSVNPNTPWENQILTEEIGQFHAAALDSIGSQYYTKANFDDFYYGKGSTYPDAHGCIGILFEQASSRGHLQESVNGPVSFSFTIRNQVTTSLSSQRATVSIRKKLLTFKRDFHKQVMAKLATEKIKSYVFSDNDPVKLNKFIAFLEAHKVDVYALNEEITVDGVKFNKGTSYQVPLEQHNPVIAKTIFEEVKSYQDSSFYDVSGWTVAHAFGLKFKGYTSGLIPNSKAAKSQLLATKTLDIQGQSYAVVVPSGQYNMHTVLQGFLDNNILVKTNTLPINLKKDKLNLSEGSLIIPMKGQKMADQALADAINSVISKHAIQAHVLSNGNSTEEVALGHPAVITIDKPSILVIVGNSVTPTSAGEVWHHLDKELGIAATYIESNRLRGISLARYNTIILPEGNYGTWGDSEVQKLKEWTQAGNTLMGIGSGAEWLVDRKLITLVERKKTGMSNTLTYQALDRESDAKVIGGSIFETKIDQTHPIFYGYSSKTCAFMHSGTRFFDATTNHVASPAVYNDNFLLSGYLPKGINNAVKGAATVTTHGVGSGRVIAFLDNPLFRGYWFAGAKAFNNALFYGKALDRRSLESED